MPGVAVLPSSPGLGGSFSSSTTSSGTSRYNDALSVRQNKQNITEDVVKHTRGASCLSMIKTMRNIMVQGKELESNGDIKGAFIAYVKVGKIMQILLDSAEYKNEASGGVVKKEYGDLQRREIDDLTVRMKAVEDRLKASEQASSSGGVVTPDEGPITTSGGSIKDRMRALQSNGLSIATTKRAPRETSSASTPPPIISRRISTQPLSPSVTQSSSLAPSLPPSTAPSPHALVSPSSFGPPSPTSSPSSSPRLPTFPYQQQLSPVSQSSNYQFPSPSAQSPSLSDVEAKFPSLADFDDSPAFQLPSVPTGLSTGSNKSIKDLRNGDPTPPSPVLRNFLIERPSSTPATPSLNTFASRPGSPTRSPLAPKPSGLSGGVANGSIGRTPLLNRSTVTPKELQAYISDYKVLLIDVRNRADFERERIKSVSVVCLEPSFLMQESVTGDALELSLPVVERGIFQNRDKFELVFLYDQDSVSFTPTMSTLQRIIVEEGGKKVLKKMPMMLVGGIEAWREEFGDEGLRRGEVSFQPSLPPPPQTPSLPNGFVTPPTPSSSSFTNSFNTNGTNGLNGSMSSSSSSSFMPTSGSATGPHQLWTPPRPRSDTNPVAFGPRPPANEHRPHFSLDQPPNHFRSPAEIAYPTISGPGPLARRPAMRNSPSSPNYTQTIVEHVASPPMGPSQSLMNGVASSITYPAFASRPSPSMAQFSAPPTPIASPPVASINPSLSRRRSDYVDQSQEALSSLQTRQAVDYPGLPTQHILRPPPAAASSALVERQDNRPRTSFSQPPEPLRLQGDSPVAIYPPTYWSDVQIATSGLKNLGNTCYMNAPIQCLSATFPFARFFTDSRWKSAVNHLNPLGSKGLLTNGFAKLLFEMWGQSYKNVAFIEPSDFRRVICSLKAQYVGTNQHDSQEFLSFLLDGIHEDLNRILRSMPWTRTPEQEVEFERLPPQVASDEEWTLWRRRNDSIIVDFFQGQFRSRLECLTCHTTSTTYNVFSILQLPIPQARSEKVPLQRCMDAFFSTEILENDDAWECPKCKVKRKASKQLSLARLPPILLIHLKRFEANGRFSDKIDTFVDFPLKSLDLTNLMPPPSPPGADKGSISAGLPTSPDDPRTQMPPYKYDLYGVTNHVGSLSGGHYTACISDRGGWKNCDDSSVRSVDPKQVVSAKAYVLFYKRVKV